MGTSFVEYKGFGFWIRDSFLESWLTTLLGEMQKLSTLESWQNSLIEHWRVQATIDGGVMSTALDEFVTDSVRRDFLLSLAQGALALSHPIAHRTGKLFIDLLAGRLKTNESSPINYLGDPGRSSVLGGNPWEPRTLPDIGFDILDRRADDLVVSDRGSGRRGCCVGRFVRVRAGQGTIA